MKEIKNFKDLYQEYYCKIDSTIPILGKNYFDHLPFEEIKSKYDKKKNEIDNKRPYDIQFRITKIENKFLRNFVINNHLRSIEFYLKLGLIVHNNIVELGDQNYIKASYYSIGSLFNLRENLTVLFGSKLINKFSAFKKLERLSDSKEYFFKFKDESFNLQNEIEKFKSLNENFRIFRDNESFEFFKRLIDIVKNELADYSFIFRRMQKDGLIYKDVKESEFRNWLEETYNISIDKLKLLDYCKTHKKEILYTTLKDSIR